MANHPSQRDERRPHDQPRKPTDEPEPSRPGDDDEGDDIPDTPPTEPEPAPIRDPQPPGQPRGPYIA